MDWRHYLIGSPHPVYIRLDHKNFDIKLEHVPGTKMVISDTKHENKQKQHMN